MQKFDKMKNEWFLSLQELGRNRSVHPQKSSQYLQFLKQNYFIYQELPRLTALVATHFRGHDNKLVHNLLKYSLSKENQNQLMLNDLREMDITEEELNQEEPSLSVLSIFGVSYYQIEHRSPACYLGLLYNIDYFYQFFGKKLIEEFEKKNISRQKMSFLCEKAIVDNPDQVLFKKIVDQLLVTDQDYHLALYTAKCISNLFSQIIDQSLFYSEDESRLALAAHFNFIDDENRVESFH